MTAKEFLSKYQQYSSSIEAKTEKVAQLKSQSQSVAMVFREKVQTSKQVNATERIISHHLDMQKDIEEDIIRLKKIQKDISLVIRKTCDDMQREVVERKYINGQTFEKIAEKTFLSQRQIYRIHGKALEKIEEYINSLNYSEK